MKYLAVFVLLAAVSGMCYGDSWTKGTDQDCWRKCGGGGVCRSFCGSNGYCCGKGYGDCPEEAQRISTNYHSCVIRVTELCEVSKCSTTEGCPLKKDNLLDKLTVLNKEFFISFEFKATSWISGWQNVIHFRHAHGGAKSVGNRVPALFVKNSGQLLYCFDVNGNNNYCNLVSQSTKQYPLNQWIKVQFSQTRENGKYIYRVQIDGKNEIEVENSQAKEFSNVEIFAADNFYTTVDGSIRNLVVNADSSTPCEGVCEHYNYKNWFETISPCFKQLVGEEKSNESCHPSILSGPLSSKIHQVVEQLNQTVLNNETLSQLSENMWNAVQAEPFKEWCPGSFQKIVRYLLVVLTQAPPYLPNAPNNYGVPIANMLQCYLHTQEGRIFFASPLVNAAMFQIVDTYGQYLETKESLNVLNNGTFGWKSACALKGLNYMKDFVYDKKDKHWGFKSWNDFFTRNLTEGARPISGKGNNKIIVAFGDNGFVNLEMDLQNNTKLWIKNESYSLFQMFDKQPALSDKFIGGTALQVFFSATKYHHFHSPVSGKVVYAANKHGIIYAVDEVNVNTDEAKLTNLQNWVKYGANGLYDTELYLAHVASRAIIIIENELLGPIALFFIGMTEISSCRIEPWIKKGVEDGETVLVEKGTPLGHFQYGGSSGAILLTKEVVEMKEKPFWNMTLLTADIKMGQPILVL